MEQVIAERNSRHLNQEQGTPLTIEPLLSLIGTDSFTSFSQKLFNGTSDLTSLPLSPTIKKVSQEPTTKQRNSEHKNK